MSKYIEITIIDTSETTNYVYRNIQNSINTYLIKNKGAVSDFNLIKDIVDRNTDAVENEIESLIPVPLYLGLMGTMLGIVIGLFLMPSISDDNFDKSIDILIGGVKIAMIASFVGLLLTTYLSGWLFKGAKNDAESLKNQFFSWAQTYLLPVLSQNTSSSLYSLQANLLKFNDTFSENVSEFKQTLSQINTTFESQRIIMEELQEVDVAQLANINVNVLKEMRKSTKELETFHQYLGNVNMFVQNASQLNENIAQQLHRTESLEDLAGGIMTVVKSNEKMMKLMDDELHQINARKVVFEEAITETDVTLKKGLDLIKETASETLIKMKDAEVLKIADKDKSLDVSRLENTLNEFINSQKNLDHNNQLEHQNATQEMLMMFKELENKFESKTTLPPIAKYTLYTFFGAGSIVAVSTIIYYLYQFFI